MTSLHVTHATLTARLAAGAPQGDLSVLPSQYPAVRRDDSVVEVLHGETIAGGLRWGNWGWLDGVRVSSCSWVFRVSTARRTPCCCPEGWGASRYLLQTLTAGWRTLTAPRRRQDRGSIAERSSWLALLFVPVWPHLPTCTRCLLARLACSSAPCKAPVLMVQAFVEAQNALTQGVLAKCGTREPFRQLYTKLWYVGMEHEGRHQSMVHDPAPCSEHTPRAPSLPPTGTMRNMVGSIFQQINKVNVKKLQQKAGWKAAEGRVES